MENLPIEGGRILGAPKGWDARTMGECLSVSALIETGEDGSRSYTTAWRLSSEELMALAGEGGTLFLRLDQPFFPVMALWAQEGRELVGTLTSRTQADAARMTALRYIALELDRRADSSFGRDHVGALHEAELLVFISAAVERLGYPISFPEAWHTRQIPVKTLGQVAAESAALAAGIGVTAGPAKANDDGTITVDLKAHPFVFGLDLAKGPDMAGEAPPLKADFARVLPGGIMDDSLYEDVEVALDRAGAPSIRPDNEPRPEGKGRWYGVAERIGAYAANVSALRKAIGGLGAHMDPASQLFQEWKAVIDLSNALDPEA